MYALHLAVTATLSCYVNKYPSSTNQCFHFTLSGTKTCSLHIWWPYDSPKSHSFKFYLSQYKKDVSSEEQEIVPAHSK